MFRRNMFATKVRFKKESQERLIQLYTEGKIKDAEKFAETIPNFWETQKDRDYVAKSILDNIAEKSSERQKIIAEFMLKNELINELPTFNEGVKQCTVL